ncbi:hypothetical protein DKM44_11955 [Deinococcus irradiatisoli]|uniref:Uncharacterized protein n=1 Tax=Deinococcus irradiatisoli TaxID=2202254 RepID=A0A2Z3JFB4_9DEIO|nr:hypothetical protein [Deinococcus irradiatisoli]AWN23853.1 hypothetical protein DKM44_11955 [Deinococcus irradiatisoli]
MTKPPLPPVLARFLKLWPGFIAAFSLLAVWGNQVGHPEGPRTLMSAGQAALPELRAAPAPTPLPSLMAAPEEQARPTPPVLPQAEARLGQAQRMPQAPDLTALGRQQTDGG